MANQIYGYNPSTYGGSGGLSSVYPSSSSYLSDPSLIGSGASRYLASSDPLAPSEASKYSSLFQTDAYRYPGSEYSAGIGERYPGSEYGAGGGGYASRIGPPGVGVGAGGGYGLVSHNSWPLPGTELGPTGYDPSIGAGIKRPSEALYHQTVLGTHNTIGQSEAFYSTNTLAKRPRFETATSLPVYPQREGQDCAHYMLTRTCKFGEACKFHHPTWVPEGGIPDWKEVPLVAVSEALPERPGEPDCPYFLKTQKCKFGVRCKFNHPKDKIETTMNEVEPVDVALLPDRPSEPPCAFYLKTGKCKFGVSCKFHHPKDIQVPPTTQENGNKEQNESAAKDDGTTTGDVKAGKPFVPFTAALLHNSKGLPIRPGEVDCPFYLKTGSCKYGATCRYNHPERTTINPPVAAGLGPAVIPSPAVNMSMGIIHPAAPVHSSIDPRLAPQPTLGLGTSLYPQRPGQTYCDFYMKTGECKFGERCKFHHPIDRSAPTLVAKQAVPNVKLTLAGFPRREGSVICPFYMKTGTCKYGATCKFDHPPPGEAIAMATVQGTAASVGGEAEGKATESNQEQEQ